ncbi:hypothetical protein SGA01_28980 [Streptomyces gardneri]|uniref:Uncharacterized protein n=1 Tax=Streptomyces gardneri TaxID=66892 RepID=A0A4Y3RKP9_9ACTN|nr:hypothetical protein SGA01_28980 [Streptomyces gardneri]
MTFPLYKGGDEVGAWVRGGVLDGVRDGVRGGLWSGSVTAATAAAAAAAAAPAMANKPRREGPFMHPPSVARCPWSPTWGGVVHRLVKVLGVLRRGGRPGVGVHVNGALARIS